MKKTLPIMIQGTHSDAGKSLLVTGLCRIFYQDGYKTTPFKAQNMSLNSYVTPDGKEIGRSQGVQAEAAGIVATADMNPILIKPSGHLTSQVIINGKPLGNYEATMYRKDFFEHGLEIIQTAYDRLASNYDIIVIEGAGSPAEINLNDRELANMRIARLTNAPVILVGDIDKGGVFASLVGTLQLLEPEDRDRIIGVVINKFRGELSLLEPGLKWFEEYTGKPVLGVIPYLQDVYMDAEDSVVLETMSSVHEKKEIDIAVIKYPYISNFTDIDPFFVEPDCSVRYVTNRKELGSPDIIILPGTKNTIEDVQFLKQTGLYADILEKHQKGESFIFGICGGYQMLGTDIADPFQVESNIGSIQGFGLLPIKTELLKDKTTVLSKGELAFNNRLFSVTGYEIHMGVTSYTELVDSFIRLEDKTDGAKAKSERVIGTYFHGIFHNDAFRAAYLNFVRVSKGLTAKEDRESYNRIREDSFDKIGDALRKNLSLDVIYKKMNDYTEQGNKCRG
ncbi:cobyric acid synthase [Bacillus sp. 165]|uniref:cobyric acid synthase n=1 Tax=Bacillus sp. 165 TaxID=1529117 RepID=UPI001ADCFE9B|nr:cobyric acid synthase [Bacillus sp. 165]MBO9129173.1 cobyric acid synthase [Bacillus sp. 165]